MVVESDKDTGRFLPFYRDLTKEESKIVIEAYGHIPYKDIIETINKIFNTNCNLWMIKKFLYKNNILTKGKGKNSFFKKIQGRRKVFFNDDFFSVPNLLNSYWAGFIAADGNIKKDKNVLNIQISDKDYEHLKSFCDAVDFSGTVSRYVRKSGIAMCNAHFYSDPLIHDLKNNFNIIPQKTFSYNFPEHLNYELQKAFVIGYIDGDGHISYMKSGNRKIPLSFGIVGASLEFLQHAKKLFNEILSENRERSYVLNGNVCSENNKKYHRFRCSSKPALIILKNLYNVDVPKLKRKWEKVKEVYDKSIT